MSHPEKCPKCGAKRRSERIPGPMDQNSPIVEYLCSSTYFSETDFYQSWICRKFAQQAELLREAQNICFSLSLYKGCYFTGNNCAEMRECEFCGVEWRYNDEPEHEDDCPVIKAQALLTRIKEQEEALTPPPPATP